ncbi:DUF2933 domain-containing protein [Virgibacillus dakarensis]|uniref:DUF2933 domain-containing protein n=1 Tax=Virgibacillus dakarensis TaxID=1917889 RepID=UPI0011241EA1|nr:DUF2933 domain-containing protein [Virgibacillus dakarensis]
MEVCSTDWGFILLLLICPLMMLFMMKGLIHGGHHNHGKHNDATEPLQPSDEVDRLDSYKVKQLQKGVELLKSQNESF